MDNQKMLFVTPPGYPKQFQEKYSQFLPTPIDCQAYESLRCLDVPKWRFLCQQQTYKLITSPLVHARGVIMIHIASYIVLKWWELSEFITAR